jgi:hypothetical protein
MRPLDIFVDAKQQRRFRRRAIRAFHKNQEYVEVIFVRRGVGEFHVEQFRPLHINWATAKGVSYDETEYLALKNEAHNLGLEIGTVHTHILNDSAPSKQDHTDGVKDGEVLVGVCEIEKTKTGRAKVVTLDFWQPQLPCCLRIVKTRKR